MVEGDVVSKFLNDIDMIEFSDYEISKLDNILSFLNATKGHQYSKTYLAEYFLIEVAEYEFYYNKIIEFSLNEFSIANILDRRSTYSTIECNFSTERFIKSGGFKEYFRLKKEKSDLNQYKSINNNYFDGTIKKSNIVIDNSINKSTQNIYPNKVESNKVVNGIKNVFVKYWWGFLIPLILIIIGLIIENLFFK